MNYSERPNVGLSELRKFSEAPASWHAQTSAPAVPAEFASRKYTTSWLENDGGTHTRVTSAPAIPMFETAFSAFAQGSLVQTDNGPVAVEDLQPGMNIETHDGRHLPLLWLGSMTIAPAKRITETSEQLFRVTEGSFGPALGAPDLLLGAGARIMRNGTGDAFAQLTNIESLADGSAVIAITPRSPVVVFHICLSSHCLIRVNDLILETYHPGQNAQYRLSQELLLDFIRFFPHIHKLSDFGPMNHRR